MIMYDEDVGITITGSPDSILNGVANIVHAVCQALSEGAHGEVPAEAIRDAVRYMCAAGFVEDEKVLRMLN
jgi:hypothetical protein